MTALLSNKHHATPRMRHHNQAECTMDTTNVSGMNFEAPVTTPELRGAGLRRGRAGVGVVVVVGGVAPAKHLQPVLHNSEDRQFIAHTFLRLTIAPMRGTRVGS